LLVGGRVRRQRGRPSRLPDMGVYHARRPDRRSSLRSRWRTPGGPMCP